MNKNLIDLKNETNIKVTDFINKIVFYSSNIGNLNQLIQDCIYNTRYSDDDFRPILTQIGFNSIRNELDDDYIVPAMAAIHLMLLSVIPMDDIFDIYLNDKHIYTQNDLQIEESFALSSILAEKSRSILNEYYGDSQRYFDIIKYYSRVLKELNISHYLEDFNKLECRNPNLEDYYYVIDYATSTLIAFSLLIGVLLANKSNKKFEKIIWRIGINLGRIRQIYDDILDLIIPEIYNTGKIIPFADLKKRKVRFPIIAIFNSGNQTESKYIYKYITNNKNLSNNEINKILKMFLSVNSKSYSKKVIKWSWKEVMKFFCRGAHEHDLILERFRLEIVFKGIEINTEFLLAANL